MFEVDEAADEKRWQVGTEEAELGPVDDKPRPEVNA